MSRRIGLTGALMPPILVAVAVGAVLAGPVPDVAPAAAQAQNRAAVIVNTGGGTAAVCVRFPEPTITGLDALQRAGLGAVVRSFSGQGAAVCGINGVGCPADDSCLTCQAPSYWAYHRAGPGSGGFTFSSAGAGSTQVTDGSVEGWQWGVGGPPAFQTVDRVCGPSEPPAPAPAPAPAPPPGPSGQPSGGAGGGGQGGPAGVVPSPSATGAVTTTTTAATATTSAGAAARPTGDDDRSDLQSDVAVSVSTDDRDGGSPWAVVLFVVLVAGLGAAAVVIRHRRSV